MCTDQAIRRRVKQTIDEGDYEEDYDVSSSDGSV